MSLKDLGRWTNRQVSWIARLSHLDQRSELLVYLQAAKLVEEVGELHAELLGRSKHQRRSKERAYDASSLEAELADVVLSTFVLSSVLRVDLGEAVAAKIEVIERRVAQDAQAETESGLSEDADRILPGG